MRLLVVEDEPDLRRVIAQSLREAGYAVDVAADGAEGLHKALGNDYNALILDLMLPKLDGLALLRELRREKKTPVLILTARDTVGDRVHGLDAGADDYLSKPFALDELAARVRALIRRALGAAASTLVIQDIAIDTKARRVTRQGQPVHLTAREYALVEYLALLRGTLVTRTMLYEHLFDETDDSLSNLVEVHIGHVRKKLGRDLIQTRRGQGYLIDA